jgi:hypothetical protein
VFDSHKRKRRQGWRLPPKLCNLFNYKGFLVKNP